jgi:hypothetical protein
LAQADAEALIRDHGAAAYREVRERERDVILPDGTTLAGRTPEHWRRIALHVARMTGKRVGLDTATRMLERCGARPGLETSRKQKGRGESILLVLEGHFKVKSVVRKLDSNPQLRVRGGSARPNTSLSSSAR